ncbi:chloride channel protein [Granulicella mallensis]|uniref:H+/Cl- antiporter ClcA/CBS domain-containing protein n=1 Tax=Granulicella mallensis TaxID=940614 RepID=A0A7W7ZR96_9BACT|nr:chloride channel protein [Granulicella mallensis]MBB5064644.1 H+/Cl- antiporter ClcA/CBS domain-containing protein [Granulicella mallensis]
MTQSFTGKSYASKLRDYSADSRILYVSVLAAGLGSVSAVAAWALLEMIALFTNLFYFHRWSFVEHDPWQSGVHWWSPLMPVLGGLLVGLIARYLSPRVRGHGMPEAIETIVFGGGKVQPRVAVLKPVATAIAIGSGGPFGAEGPVIITGGAIGSVLGQLLPMTGSERTVLMVAGASAGMAATFNCPMSATLLAVEILLFEWRPRSLVPVAIACVTASAVRRLLLGPQSLLHMAPTGAPIYHSAILCALILGIVAAFVAAGLSKAVHFSEAMFAKLPIHWMWWPAIGGLGIGLGGLIFPKALGVGYSTIQEMITGDTAWKLLAGILVIKSLIWVFSLGSNTAGSILAPLLMIGGAMGAVMGHLAPVMSQGAWVLVGMASVLTGAIGCPLTSAMLALELTHNGGLMLPVLLASVAAYAVSVLVMPRSMLTESLSQRGLHLSREFGVDPLETMLASQAMHTSVFALNDDATRKDAFDWLSKMEERGGEAWSHWQRVFPLVDAEGRLGGLLTRSQMMTAAKQADLSQPLVLSGSTTPTTVSPRNTLRECAGMMAETKLTAFPVVNGEGKLVGIITIDDLLKGRSEQARRESDRERVLRLRWPFGGRAVGQSDK